MAFPATSFSGSGTNTLDEIVRYFTDGPLPGVKVLSCNQNKSMLGFNIQNTKEAQILMFPFLQAIDRYSESGGQASFVVTGNDALKRLFAPSLIVSNAPLFVQNNGSLTDVDLGFWQPVNGQDVIFSHNALSKQSVTDILFACISNGSYVSGVVDVSGGYKGGTNASAAAAPDYWYTGTLTGRGVTVHHN